MSAALLAALLALAVPPGAPASSASKAAPATRQAPGSKQAPASKDELSPAEKEFCASELEVIANRKKLFQAQGLTAAEIAAKNEGPTRELADCRKRYKEEQRRAAEHKADLEEAARRAGPNATPLERDQAWRQVRRERLASKNPASLNAEEKAELEAGMKEELEATHQALDTAHQRSPEFMRVVHSAISCYHAQRKNELKEQIATEENLVKLGTGDRLKLYNLKSELRTSEEILERNTEVARSLPSGLDRCTAPTVAVVAHCLALSRSEPACESEEIQQYLRFVK